MGELVAVENSQTQGNNGDVKLELHVCIAWFHPELNCDIHNRLHIFYHLPFLRIFPNPLNNLLNLIINHLLHALIY
jgi:hypothetical protein